MTSFAQDSQKLLIETSKSEFSKKCRRVSLKNIPCGVLNQDILELLKPYFYQQIHIDKNSQSCKAVLLDGDCAEKCISDLNGKVFRGQRLAVSLASCDFMLCITQLPLSYTHNQFLSLLAPFGTTERCFLVHSNITGESKGYGCVEFTSKESSIKAKNHLNGATMDNHILQVHWLDSIPSVYCGLYSRCLLVEDLPADYRENAMFYHLFAQYAVPKFCQLANCEVNNFGVVEYHDAASAEESWQKINGSAVGNHKLKVSFCVPGPCGLVVLNALKASRDLKRANPTGGLLPTPTQQVDQTAQSLIHHKKGIPSSIALTAIENGIFNANAVKDPEIHHLLTALQNRLVENNPSLNPSAIHPGVWNQHAQSFNPVALNQLPPNEHLPNHMVSLRSRSGSISSCDSGAKVEDEVFEPTRRRSQEDQCNFDNWSNTKENNIKFQHGIRNDNRTLYESTSTATSLQQNIFLPSLHNNSLHFLREDSQRSESSDSAYSGSQGSNASENSFPLLERTSINQSNLLSNPNPAPKHRPSGLLGDAPCHQFHPSKLPPGIQRFPAPIGQPVYSDANKLPLSTSNSSLAFCGSSGSAIFHTSSEGGRILRSRHALSNENHSNTIDGNLPRTGPSAFDNVTQNKCTEPTSAGLLPRPEFSKADSLPTKVPVLLFSGKSNKAHCKTDFSSLDKAAVNTRVAPTNGHETPKYHHRRTPNSALSADSPTQLQLLGSSLMEGLLGDSPRSTGPWSMSSSSGNCRLLRALNLMSPTDFQGAPQTPLSVRNRVGNVLPSPEPSPEAGAYVGQHSQGIGGHYADSYGLAGDIVALVTGSRPQTPASAAIIHKRRKSNET